MSGVTRTQRLTIAWAALVAVAVVLLATAIAGGSNAIAGTPTPATTTTDSYPADDTGDVYAEPTPEEVYLATVSPDVPYATDTQLLNGASSACQVLAETTAPNEDTLVGIMLGLSDYYGWLPEETAAVLAGAISFVCPEYSYVIANIP